MDDADSKPSRSTPAGSVKSFSFRRSLVRQWRESVRYFGWPRSVAGFVAALGRALVELIPSRRQARFGDLDYDWEQAVDTTRANVRFRTQLIAALSGSLYFASDPWIFEQIMQALPINFQDFTFIDLGSGKGRTLLMAADYGFKSVVGVELLHELHRVAEENIRKFSASHPHACIASHAGDARDFRLPAEPLVVYLFNPFPEPTFAEILEKLRKSVAQAPRPVFIAYRYIEFEKLLSNSKWLEKVAGSEQWAVWKNREIGFF